MATPIHFGDERLPDRFWSKVAPCPITGCWLWTATRDRSGYGRYWLGDRLDSAHRVTQSTAEGAIPTHLQVDHLCRVRACCNPLHLELVTPAENSRRGRVGEVAAAYNLAKTHCPQGHEYSGTNLRTRSHGGRDCRTCHRLRQRIYVAKRKAAA